ncbi:MAG: FG-GAP-like repeat-containing protein [Terriglobales bacterium]
MNLNRPGSHGRLLSFVSLVLVLAIAAFARIGAPGTSSQAGGERASAPAANPLASAKSLFLPAVAYQTGGTGAGAMAVGDLNGDGNLDVAVANSCGAVCPNGAVSVSLGNGDGTFKPAVLYDTGGQYNNGVVIADVNGDGHPDLIVTNMCVIGEANCGTGLAADGVVGVLLGRGDGTFEPVVLYDAGGETTESLAVADVNRDGKLDVIVTNWDDRFSGNNSIGVLLGNGDGTFQAALPYSSGGCGREAFSVAAGDLDLDGNPDLIVANANGDIGSCGQGTVGVLLGNGDGTFQPAVQYDAGGLLTSSAILLDVNGDGYLDAVVTNACGPSCRGTGSVAILFGNGDGTLQRAALYSSGNAGTSSAAFGYVNGDDNLDLLIASSCSPTPCKKGAVGLAAGTGPGTFAKVKDYDSVSGDSAIRVADVNGDGRPDLLVTNSGGGFNTPGSLRVLLNNPAVLNTTKTTVTSSLNPSQAGQSVTFTAEVSVKTGSLGYGESVTFFDGTTELASVPLSGNEASYTTSSLSAKTHKIKAVYGGDPWYKGSSGNVKQVVENSPK